MTYAFITDGLDAENKAHLDAMLEESTVDEKAKARREREAVEQAMRFMS